MEALRCHNDLRRLIRVSSWAAAQGSLGNLLQPGGLIIAGLRLFIQGLGLSQNHKCYNLIDMVMFQFTTTVFLLPKPIPNDSNFPNRPQLGSIPLDSQALLALPDAALAASAAASATSKIRDFLNRFCCPNRCSCCQVSW